MSPLAEPSLAARALGGVVLAVLLVAPGWALDRLLGRDDEAPALAAWLHRVGLSVAWVSASALALAQLGWFRIGPLVALAFAPCVPLALRIARGAISVARSDAGGTHSVPLRRTASRRFAPRDALLVVALGFVAVTCLWPPFEDVLGGRDNGVYVAAGVRLATYGAIRFQDPLVEQVPAEVRGLFLPVAGPVEMGVGSRFAGFYLENDEGRVAPQFMPLFSLWIATVLRLMGFHAALAVPLGFGILALAWIHRTGEELGGPVVGLAALGLAGFDVLEMWFGRSHLSELPDQAMSFLALASAMAWVRGGGRGYAVAAVSALALSLVTRIDALLVAAPLAAALVLVVAIEPGRKGERALLVTGAASLVWVAVTWLTTARSYVVEVFFKNLPDQPAEWPLPPWALGAIALAAATALLVARKRAGPPLARAVSGLDRLGPWLAVALVALAAYGWWIRPHLVRGTQAVSLIKLASYLGAPVLAAAVTGAAMLVADLRSPARMLFVAATLPITILYAQHSRNRIDQFWEMRRFVSVPVPALAISAAFAGGAIAASLRLRLRGRTIPIGAVLVLAAAAWVARERWTSSATLRQHVEDEGAVASIAGLCDLVPPDAVVIADSRYESPTAYLTVPLAYLCGRDVLEVARGVHSPERLARAAELLSAKRAVWIATIGTTPLFTERLHPRYAETYRYRGPWLVPTLWWPPEEIAERAFAVDLLSVEPGPPERRTALEMGPDESGWLDGFYGPEVQPGTQIRYRWTRSDARVYLPGFDTAHPPPLYLKLASQRLRGDAPIRVAVGLDGGAARDIEVGHGFEIYELRLAPSGGPPVLAIRGGSMAGGVSGGGDRRDLGVSLDWIAWDVPQVVRLGDRRSDRVVAGFFGVEKGGRGGRGFRWTREKASMYLPACPEGPVEVRIDLDATIERRGDQGSSAGNASGGEVRPIRLRIGGETLGPYDVPRGWQRLVLTVPSGLRDPGDAAIPRVDLVTEAGKVIGSRGRDVGVRVARVEAVPMLASAAPSPGSAPSVRFESLE